jgi:hypothetical protein
VPAAPGSIETFVMRTIGWRAKPSARAQPPDCRRPIAPAEPRSESAARSRPSTMSGVRAAATPSSSQPNVPSPPGSVASAVMFSPSDP